MRTLAAALVLLGCCIAPRVTAHHSRANFLNETIVLQGTVVAFHWENPHALVEISVGDANGNSAQWQIETQATPTLVRSG